MAQIWAMASMDDKPVAATRPTIQVISKCFLRRRGNCLLTAECASRKCSRLHVIETKLMQLKFQSTLNSPVIKDNTATYQFIIEQFNGMRIRRNLVQRPTTTPDDFSTNLNDHHIAEFPILSDLDRYFSTIVFGLLSEAAENFQTYITQKIYQDT
uniref:Uncharacterized protein n=1 Tax=Romanomermis culicivorax TaxID=13658 RepID=A0A915I879_ROMCU